MIQVLDHFAAKKIRANLIDGNRNQAIGYYQLTEEVLEKLEDKEFMPLAVPDECHRCHKGVIVYSISSCQSCFHCSNEECDYRGCGNGVPLGDEIQMVLPTPLSRIPGLADRFRNDLVEVYKEFDMKPVFNSNREVIEKIRELKRKAGDE